jgi:chromosomal replication initiation ATPase DnaA
MSFAEAELIIHQVAYQHGLTVSEVKKGARTKHIGPARAEARRRLRAETDLSHREIAYLLGWAWGRGRRPRS